MNRTQTDAQGTQEQSAMQCFALKDAELRNLRLALKRVFSAVDLKQIKNVIASSKETAAKLKAALDRINPEKAASRAAAGSAAAAVVQAAVSAFFFDDLLPIYKTSPREAKERVLDEVEELKQAVADVNLLRAACAGALNAVTTAENRLSNPDRNAVVYLTTILATSTCENFPCRLCQYFEDNEGTDALRKCAVAGNGSVKECYSSVIAGIYNPIIDNAKKEPALAPFINADADVKMQWKQATKYFDETQKRCLQAETLSAYNEAVADLSKLSAFFDIADAQTKARAALKAVKPKAYKQAKTACEVYGDKVASRDFSLTSRIMSLKNAVTEFTLLGDYSDSSKQKKSAEQALDEIYQEVCKAYSSATSVSEYKNAADCFEKLDNYKDSAALCEAALEKAKEYQYAELCDKLSREKSISGLNGLLVLFDKLDGYKDSAEKADWCRQEIERLRLEQEENARLYEAKQKKKVFIVAATVIALIVASILITKLLNT